MWTTSSLLTELPRRAAVLTAALLLAAPWGAAGLRAADDPHAPLPSRAKPREVPREVQPPAKPVEPQSLKVARVEKTRDPATVKLAGSRFLQLAKAPIRIEVTLRHALDQHLHATGPVIVLNGKRLPDTRVVPGKRDTLVAFIPDGARLKDENTVTVEWVGDPDRIAKKEEFKFKASDVMK